LTEWIIKEHIKIPSGNFKKLGFSKRKSKFPDFFKDLDKLSGKELEIFYKKKKKIKQNPERQKHLKGGKNCYREPITENIRLIYSIEGNVVWLLTIGKHDNL